MGRPARVSITRDRRTDGTVTYALRIRIGGVDNRVPLGNTGDGWDEARADAARRQQLAKIELGLWSPSTSAVGNTYNEEPTFRELATDWLDARKQNPAIRSRTTDLNQWQLRRYLVPFFGDLLPSQISSDKVKQYRRRIHAENAHIRAAATGDAPLRDPRSGQLLRTLSNDSINKTLRTLAAVLDEAEDGGWVVRNVARGRRMREPLERRRSGGALDMDEFLALVEAGGQLDQERHKPATLEKSAHVRALRDDTRMEWNAIANRLGVARATAFYLYHCLDEPNGSMCGARRPVIATLGLAGPRVTELCQLDIRDIDLAKARFYINDAKTEAGIRSVDIHPRLRDELTDYWSRRESSAPDAPAFPTRTGTRRNKDNVRLRIIAPAVTRANALRAQRDEPPIRAHVTPHTLRRTYITFMVAAGHDLPYVQAQVGHTDPAVTLAVYAQVMRRPDRDQLRTEIRTLLGEAQEVGVAIDGSGRQTAIGTDRPRIVSANVRGIER